MSAADTHKNWSRLVAKVWSDEGLKKRLMADPKTVLREHGIQIPAGMNVTVHENSPSQLHIALPARPGADTELAEHELEAVSGGGCCQSLGTNC
ncbi:MAG TPA: NHLP leader peptide family RiPP precursor [Candidatus Nitrosotenuis sp.]|nr:NHLP leader peptide family RiPP precursor [Candidatus Nitrosotenuis sp.]